jgi:hypothetical protein
MDTEEARTLLRTELAGYRAKGYHDLVTLIKSHEHREIVGASGTIYQLEIYAFWDAKPNEVLRVSAAIEDGGIRAYFPLTDDFLVAPSGEFVGE